MSRPIFLTEKHLETYAAEFIETLRKTKMFSGKVNYTKSLVYEDDVKAYITFESNAFYKMFMLLQSYDSEVAWHGVVKRDPEVENHFIITDILVYPQEVTGATVNTDQVAYATWLYQFDDETFNNIRMQGHSHVSMPTSPSATDETHQQKILNQIAEDDYYIFMIWNKKFERTIKIYDLKYNTLYENKDIEVSYWPEFETYTNFILDSKKLVKSKYQYGGNVSAYQTSKPASAAQTTAAVTPAATPATPAAPASAAHVATTNQKNNCKKTKTKPKTTKPTCIGFGYCGKNSLPDYYDDDGYGIYD